MQNSITFNVASNEGTAVSCFYASHLCNDSIVTKIEGSYNLAKDSLKKIIGDITGLAIDSVDDCDTIVFEDGALFVEDMVEQNNCLSFELIFITKKIDASSIRSHFNGLEYEEPRVEGRYDLRIKHVFKGQMGLETNDYRRTTNSFNHLSQDMYPDIDIEMMMRCYSESEESILILSGLPGTGKTCFAKMMMAAHAKNLKRDITIIYVKDRDILKKDSFWAMMTAIEPHLIILDDLDSELLPRSISAKAENAIVSNMLSYTDGIFEVKTKVVITTNMTESSIDKALVRPGRCFDAINLPQLTRDQASTIWTNTFKHDIAHFDNKFGDAKAISQASIVSESKAYAKNSEASYLRNPAISVRKLVESGKTISEA
jgi:hypothetical protein